MIDACRPRPLLGVLVADEDGVRRRLLGTDRIPCGGRIRTHRVGRPKLALREWPGMIRSFDRLPVAPDCSALKARLT